MKHFPKRIIAWLLALMLLLTLLPTAAFAARQDVWKQIAAYEKAHLRRTRGVDDERTAADYAALSEGIAKLVTSSTDYRFGTCTYDGTNAMFFWEDADGEPQGYSPTLRARTNGAAATTDKEFGVEQTVSYAKRGGSPDAKNVYLIGPWYGHPTEGANFTDQYQKEANSIAATTGGTYTLYSGSKATIGAVAKAMESGAVVFFDSHGVTDYDKYMGYSYPDSNEDVYDSVTGAHTSYLTIISGTGLTSADQAAVKAADGTTYYHAFRSDGFYCVDGTAIANHMTKDAPNSLLWMAICLGMATEGLSAPLRAKGVETVYGYSESVAFVGDYEYEASFWTQMKAGKTVAEAIATMKTPYAWDPGFAKYSAYNTLAKARKYFVAFPVVVSSEDKHPGQRRDNTANFGADSLQTVQSTWTLQASNCEHSYVYSLTTPPTLTEAGIITGVCSKCSRTVRVEMPALNQTDYTYTVLVEPTCAEGGVCRYNWRVAPYGDFTFDEPIPKTNNHTWDEGVVTTEPTCTEKGVKTFTCTVCKTTKTEEIAATGVHTWDDGKVTTEPTCTEAGVETYTCTVCKETKTEELATLGHIDENKDNRCDRCGEKLGEDPTPAEDVCTPFTDIDQSAWYHDGVHYMIENGMMNGVGNGMFEPNGSVTRAMLVTILYRQAGSPSVEGKTNPFIDVKPNKYYTNAVIWAFQNGIVNGTTPTTFEPEEPVTREQIATILYRREGTPEVKQDLSAFVDTDQVSNYAHAAMQWAVAEGVIKGDGNRLNAKGDATRAEIATMLMRYLTK